MSYDPNEWKLERTESWQKHILRDGVPVPCTHAEWITWMESEAGRRESAIGATEIDGVRVMTDFQGCFIGPAGKLDETLLFETCAVEGRSVAVLSRYRSLKAARIGHKRWVTVIRKELACDDGGAKPL